MSEREGSQRERRARRLGRRAAPPEAGMGLGPAALPEERTLSEREERRPSGRGRWVVAFAAALLAIAGCTDGARAPTPTAELSARAEVGPGCPPPLGPQSTAPSALPDLELGCLGPPAGAAPAVPLRRLTGRPAVINLWASWCAPCREELPAFARLHEDTGSRLQVIGVASRDRPGAAMSYAADAGLPFVSLVDESGDLGRALRRPALPVTVLLAADGAVVEVYQGAPLTDATLRKLVRDELGVDVR